MSATSLKNKSRSRIQSQQATRQDAVNIGDFEQGQNDDYSIDDLNNYEQIDITQ